MITFGMTKLPKPLYAYVRGSDSYGSVALFKTQKAAEDAAEGDDERMSDDIIKLTHVYDSADEYKKRHD